MLLLILNVFSFQVYETNIKSILVGILNKQVNCTEIIRLHFDRIKVYDPKLNTVVKSIDRAYQRAQELDDYFLNTGNLIGPLHCIPIIVKDNYNVQSIPTSGGVLALKDSIPDMDCEVVQSLQSKGGIAIYKANMPDFASDGMETNSSVIGSTLNPYNYSITPYGSSGGTAVGISASFGVIGLGSDTQGSIQDPASALNLVGLRPTQNLVPSEGILPLILYQDVSGLLTRSVTDLATAFEFMVNPIFEKYGPQNYTKWLNPKALNGTKVGMEWDFLANLTTPINITSTYEVVEIVENAANIFTNAGAKLLNTSILLQVFSLINEASNASDVCGTWLFKYGVDQYLSQIPNAPYKNLEAILKSGKLSKGVIEFVQQAVNSTGNLNSSSCINYREAKEKVAKAIEDLMDQNGVDALIFPNTNQAAPSFVNLYPQGFFFSVIIPSFSGLPALQIPIGITPSNNAPFGITLLGKRFQEAKLISYAFSFENLYNFRVPPKSTPPLN